MYMYIHLYNAVRVHSTVSCVCMIVSLERTMAVLYSIICVLGGTMYTYKRENLQ